MSEAVESVVEEEVVVEEPEFTDEELQAMEHGWAPKSEWQGDDADWISAKQFNQRGELFGKIKSLERTNTTMRQEFQQATSHMKELLAKAKETEYKRAVTELKADKRRAVQDGETERILDIDDKIDALNQEHTEFKETVNAAPAAPQEAQPTPEFIEWKGNNNWYGTDEDMTLLADSVGIGFIQRNPNATTAQVFDAVDKQIKKAYPEKFTNSRRERPGKVEAGKSSGRAASKTRFSKADLSEEQRAVMNTMVKTGVMTEDDYIKELARIGEIGG